MSRRFSAAHPQTGVIEVPALPVDVHDLDGLRRIGELLTKPLAPVTRARNSSPQPEPAT
jgi:hypothetical protein